MTGCGPLAAASPGLGAAEAGKAGSLGEGDGVIRDTGDATAGTETYCKASDDNSTVQGYDRSWAYPSSPTCNGSECHRSISFQITLNPAVTSKPAIAYRTPKAPAIVCSNGCV